MSEGGESNPKAMNEKLTTIVLCGKPGVGKTTLIQKISKEIQQGCNISCRGFYTEEVREMNGGRRLGFDVVTLNGHRGVLAREALNTKNIDGPTVGKYRVFINEFENIALPLLETHPRSSRELLIIDEIGKMELKSRKFLTMVKSLIDNFPILATIPVKTDKPLPVVEEIRCSPRTKVFQVTPQNRDYVGDEIKKVLMEMLT